MDKPAGLEPGKIVTFTYEDPDGQIKELRGKYNKDITLKLRDASGEEVEETRARVYYWFGANKDITYGADVPFDQIRNIEEDVK